MDGDRTSTKRASLDRVERTSFPEAEDDCVLQAFAHLADAVHHRGEALHELRKRSDRPPPPSAA